MAAGKIRLITLGGALAAVMVVESLARSMAAADIFEPITITLLARLAQIGLILALIELFQNSPAEVGLGRGRLRPGIKAGLHWSLVFGGVVALAFTAMLAADFHPLTLFRLSIYGGSGTLLLYLITGVVVAPLAEELFFRGMLYGFFRRWGIPAGVILTTTVFSLLHLVELVIPVTQIVGGVVFCLAYEKEKNLWASYTIHALGNAAIFMIGLLPDMLRSML
ncbi:MAG: CPBP family intramembrane glutamic endopeptidase [Desulfosudaceae bacterium]